MRKPVCKTVELLFRCVGGWLILQLTWAESYASQVVFKMCLLLLNGKP